VLEGSPPNPKDSKAKLRDRNFTIPVLMLTARDTVADKIIGLDAGADAYMVKPFDLEELMAQVRALLRRRVNGASSKLCWGSLCLNPITYEVTYDDKFYTLLPKSMPCWSYWLRMGGEY
jgi:DNA-binding response OmpR family regulator